MPYVDADKLRGLLKENIPTPYDAKFCAMINELAAESDVDRECYQAVFEKYFITNAVDSIEKIDTAIDWIMNDEVGGKTADILTELRELIELRRKIISGSD